MEYLEDGGSYENHDRGSDRRILNDTIAVETGGRNMRGEG